MAPMVTDFTDTSDFTSLVGGFFGRLIDQPTIAASILSLHPVFSTCFAICSQSVLYTILLTTAFAQEPFVDGL